VFVREKPTPRLVLTIAVLAAALLGAALARGELVQSGDVRLAFDGGFEPHALPRDRAVPVTLSLGGSILGVNGSRPPAVRRFSIAVNRYGRVFTRGLPACPVGELEQTSTQEALSRCRGALVGHGRVTANVDFPSLAFPEKGAALAFNGRAGGRPAILLHIYGSRPVQATVVLVFKISHPRRGPFGTVFTTTVPKIASDLGYLANIRLNFDRRYAFGGHPRSFLSARCAAPSGFPGATFIFARGRFLFDNGQRVTTTLTRDCRVR
jgi:hypothetical protein